MRRKLANNRNELIADIKSRFNHSLADEVSRGNQLQPFMLAANFVDDGVRNLRINF